MRCCPTLARVAPAALIPLLLAATAARAADQPVTRPTRDVDVTYRVTDSHGQAAEQRVRWDAAAGRERIDPPTPGLHVIYNANTRMLDSVRDAEKLVLEVPSAAPGPDETATYAKRGSATVMGLACTVWQATRPALSPEMCFTDDGVLLRVADGGQTLAEAVRVTFAPSNPADFVVPPDYRRVGGGGPASNQPAAKEATP